MLLLLWIQQGYYSYDDLLPLELNRENQKEIDTEHNRKKNSYIYTKCISSWRPEKLIVESENETSKSTRLTLWTRYRWTQAPTALYTIYLSSWTQHSAGSGLGNSPLIYINWVPCFRCLRSSVLVPSRPQLTILSHWNSPCPLLHLSGVSSSCYIELRLHPILHKLSNTHNL